MNVSEFREALIEMSPTLNAWGKFVLTSISKNLAATNISVQMSGYRVKEIDSAIGKLGRKKYENPFVQMTDLVGVRFVVLLSPELIAIGNALESIPYWDYSKDRDPGAEVIANPKKFDYQSLHYVVTNKNDIKFEEACIPAGIKCEVQIRTILQHAYAEVTHDRLYKAPLAPPARAERFIASSGALIETTDHLFCETIRLLNEENGGGNSLLVSLAELHTQLFPGCTKCDKQLNMVVLDTFRDYLGEDTIGDLQDFFRREAPCVNRIREKMDSDVFWMQPVSLVAYLLVSKMPEQVFDLWPFASSHDALETVYSDLGIATRQ